MNILIALFFVCVVILAWLWHDKPASRRTETSSSPPTPNPLDGRLRLDPLSERNTEHAFLQLVIAQDAGEESRQLQDRLAQAEHHDQYLRRALFLMGLLIMLSLAGLGYCAILLPGVFCDPTHVVIRSLRYLGVASLVSWVGFFGDFLWHRAAVGRLHRECRRQVLALPEGPPRELDASGLAVHFRVQPPLQNHEDHPAIPGSAAVTTT